MQSLSERAKLLLIDTELIGNATGLRDTFRAFLKDVIPVLEEPVIDRIAGGDSDCPHCMDAEGIVERRTRALAQMAVMFRSGKLWSMEQCFEEAETYLAEAEKRAK